MKSKIVLALCACIVLTSFDDNSKLSVTEKVKEVFRSTQEIRTLSYELTRHERIAGRMHSNSSQIKMQKKPIKIYYRELTPNDGLEVLFPHPEDHNKALVNPNGFPYMNLKLDPRGEIMMKNQHYTILDAGYDGVIAVLEHLFYKYKGQINDMMKYQGMTLFDGHTCDMILMENNSFRYISYPVTSGETVRSIAKKYRLSEYMIREKNSNLYLNDLKEGDVLKLPTDYASKMKLYIDVERRIPLKVEIYDEKGLFEKYEFKNVVINPGFSDQEFLDTYQEYSFN